VCLLSVVENYCLSEEIPMKGKVLKADGSISVLKVHMPSPSIVNVLRLGWAQEKDTKGTAIFVPNKMK
jgi:hypothetical protein